MLAMWWAEPRTSLKTHIRRVYGHTHFNERVNFGRVFLQCLVWMISVNFRSYLEVYRDYGLQIFTTDILSAVFGNDGLNSKIIFSTLYLVRGVERK